MSVGGRYDRNRARRHPFGLLRFEKQNGDWRSVERALTFWSLTCVGVDPEDPRSVYVGTERSGVFISRDGGASWARPDPNIPRLLVTSLLPVDGSLLVGTAPAELYRTGRAHGQRGSEPGLQPQELRTFPPNPDLGSRTRHLAIDPRSGRLYRAPLHHRARAGRLSSKGQLYFQATSVRLDGGAGHSEGIVLTAEENELLTKVGPGTPMGDLMRRYWQPIAASAQLKDDPVRSIRILGEDLTLYRDESGTLGLIAQRCAHRRVDLRFGIPCEVGLRCAYHGWRYDETGQCIETPYDEAEGIEDFKGTVRLTAYPVQERRGVIFTYMGPQPAPLLPNWDIYMFEDVYHDIGSCVIPCNYLQIMENSLDPVHVEWLHTHFSNYVLKRLGRPDLKRQGFSENGNPLRHEKIGFDIFDYGIVKRRVMTGQDESHPYWRIGHPIVFPNILKTTGFQYRVPIDDDHTYHWWVFPHRVPEGQTYEPQTEIPYYDVPMPGLDEKGAPTWSLLDNNSGQDIMMWITQGGVADRSEERLSASDRGVVLYRNLLKANLAKLARGEDPINVFRDPEDNEYLELPSEYWEMSQHSNGLNQTGGSSKYSPVVAEAIKKAGKEDLLKQPVH